VRPVTYFQTGFLRPARFYPGIGFLPSCHPGGSGDTWKRKDIDASPRRKIHKDYYLRVCIRIPARFSRPTRS